VFSSSARGFVKESELRERFPRSVVLVIADFRRDMGEVRSLRRLGARIEVAGLGGNAERQELAGLGVDTEAVSESRHAALEAALDRLGAADAVLFGAGDWDTERHELFEAEREQAIADGRSLRPFVARGDEAYAFLGSPAERAAFALARAAGGSVEMARKFALREQGKGQERGHKVKNRQPGKGARSGAAGTGRGKTR
jgi:hypothetical protein